MGGDWSLCALIFSGVSEHHRTVAVGRDLWAHLVHPLLQQGHPEQGAQKLLKFSKGETPQPLWATSASHP